MRTLAFISLLTFSLLMPCATFADEPVPGPKPLVVLVFDQHCKVWCTQVRPVMRELEQQYEGKVEFAELDSTASALEASKTKAKQLGVLGYFTDVGDYVPAVLVFSPRRKLIKELVGPKKKSDYKSNIDKALSAK